MPLYLTQHGNMNREDFEINQRAYIDMRTYKNLLYNIVEISNYFVIYLKHQNIGANVKMQKIC